MATTRNAVDEWMDWWRETERLMANDETLDAGLERDLDWDAGTRPGPLDDFDGDEAVYDDGQETEIPDEPEI